MRVFDLHCDTIGKCCNKKIDLRDNNSLDISLNRMREYDAYTQVFAIWIPDEYRKENAVNYFNKVCDVYDYELNKNKDLITSFITAENDDKRIKSILAVEGGAALGGEMDGLYHLYDRGVRVLTLTWNAENEIASGAFCESGGLTEFGKEVVKKCETLGIVVDASHLNRQSFYDLAENSQKPFIASHSNPDIVDNEKGKKRNLTDEQIEVIRQKNGLIGLNFYSAFLDFSDKCGIDALRVHLDYLLERGCEDIIALGSDFDGCRITEGIEGAESMCDVFNELIKYGYSQELVEKLFYNNANNFFRKIKGL